MEAAEGSLIDWGVAVAALGGEGRSGDCYVVKPLPEGALIAVMDGLGHGPEASEVANAAGGLVGARPQESVISLVRRCHDGLRGTRGVVMSLASLNGLEGTMTWIGVGNVEGLLVRADGASQPPHDTLLLRAGVVGRQLPPLQATVLPLTAGDIIIFATDGIDGRFTEGIDLSKSPQQIATSILSRHSKGNDDALVLVARYLGKKR